MTINKGLEALKELRFQVGNIRAGTHDNPPQLSPYLVRDMDLFDIIETELKALGIIKEKVLVVDIFMDIIDINENMNLTQDEFKLLKEILKHAN